METVYGAAMKTRLIAAFAVAGVTFGAALPAQALPLAPIPGTDSSIVSATNYLVPDQGIAEMALNDYTCIDATPLPVRARSLATALGLADKVLASEESSRALRAFAAAGIYNSVPKLEGAFALAMMNNRPGAALAASLRMYRLRPDARHLINAATLLTGFDAPDVAYDLLAAAKPRASGLMAGVDGAAAWQSAMGAVLLAYGHYAPAKVAYETALEREPLMSTARQGIARALKCMGDDEQASLWQGRSQTVIDPGPSIVTSPGEDGNPPTWTAPGHRHLIDLKNGKKGPVFGKFVPPPIANIPLGGYSQYAAADWAASLEMIANGIPVPELDIFQEQYLDYVTYFLQTDPVIVQLVQESADLDKELQDIPGDSTCATVDHFGAFWSWIGKNYDVARRTSDRVYLIYTAAAANTDDPVFNAYLNDQAAYLVKQIYSGFLFGLMGYSQQAERHAEAIRNADDEGLRIPYCETSFVGVQPQTKYTPAGPQGEGERTGPCSALGTFAKTDILSIDLPIPGAPVKPKIKINCERVSLSAKFANAGLPYADIGLFASFDYEFFTNDFVLSAGGFYELGPLGVKVGPSLRMGYDSDGNFTIKDFSFVVKTPLGTSGPKGDSVRARRPAGTTWLIVY